MTRSALRVEECCNWCRRPVNRCSDPSCDDAGTYSGILVRGEWQEMEEGKSSGSRLLSGAAAAA